MMWSSLKGFPFKSNIFSITNFYRKKLWQSQKKRKMLRRRPDHHRRRVWSSPLQRTPPATTPDRPPRLMPQELRRSVYHHLRRSKPRARLSNLTSDCNKSQRFALLYFVVWISTIVIDCCVWVYCVNLVRKF